MLGLEKRLKLYGFNNLTKTLSFNIYDVCYAKSQREQIDYIKYIDEQYNSERLTNILCDVTDMIGASVLNISKQDYDPQGASVTLLISEKGYPETIDESCNCGRWREEIAAHLDKSHVTVHTYPEYHPDMLLQHSELILMYQPAEQFPHLIHSISLLIALIPILSR